MRLETPAIMLSGVIRKGIVAQHYIEAQRESVSDSGSLLTSRFCIWGK